jgi:hypothetical protein
MVVQDKAGFDGYEEEKIQSVKKDDNLARQYLKMDKLGASGEWGGEQVLASNIQGGVSKLGFENMGFPRK